MGFQQINVGSQAAALLVGGGGRATLVFNQSAQNTVYIGDICDVVSDDPSIATPLPPLASVVVDGNDDLYGICAPGDTAFVSVMPGGLNFFQLVELLLKTLLISASAGNGIFVYNNAPGKGDLAGSWTAQAGTDPFGNPVSAGLELNGAGGSVLRIIPSLTDFSAIEFTSGIAAESQPATISDATGGSGGAQFAALQIFGPVTTTDASRVSIQMASASKDGVTFSSSLALFWQGLAGAVLSYFGFDLEAGTVTGVHPGTGTSILNQAVPESWQNLALPPTWAGRCRVKILAEQKFAVLDLNISGGTTNPPVLPNLPAGYFPSSDTSVPVGFSGANAGTNARLNLTGGGGAIGIAGLPAVLPGRVSATILYPLD